MRYLLLLTVLVIAACETSSPKVDKEAVKKEIVAIEKEFATFLKDSGVAAAFYKYAAPDAVMKRGNGKDTLVKGREAIRESFSGATYETSVAEWAPDFVNVSDDGTMAYTFGKYKWYSRDTSNKEVYTGVFHTVWKKMADGSWKYVWD